MSKEVIPKRIDELVRWRGELLAIAKELERLDTLSDYQFEMDAKERSDVYAIVCRMKKRAQQFSKALDVIQAKADTP